MTDFFPTSGVSWDSRSPKATFSAVVGTWDGVYPLANVGDLVQISKIAKGTPAGGGFQINFVLPAQQTVGFVGLVNHNIPVGGTVRLVLFSDAAGTVQVYDSGTLPCWPTGAPVNNYPSTRPFVLSGNIPVQSGAVVLGGLTAGITIGGIEIAKWWGWDGLGDGKQFGFQTSAVALDLLGAGAQPVAGGAPRALSGQIDFLDLATASTTGLDFQFVQGQAKPFVYVQNYEDATTWARTCMLARNVQLPASVGAVYRHDAFQFRFVEHLR